MPERSRQAGFTLVELLIVLVIIGVSTALVATSFGHMLSSGKDKHWVDKTVYVLNRLRVKAILSGRAQIAEIEYATGTIRAADSPPEASLLRLPEKYEFKDLNAAALLSDESEGGLKITFYPDGSATEARFALVMPNAGWHGFHVRGLTGQIESVEAGPA
ncbi:MAG: prepilin-type N-terminal cleavage/methylation domain-containing protein [Rhodocyclaceae bacterium]|nr:prepilin-type N-terminal cleavage/methylation domain-containing protein [Rhodocyclaceae bacterium]